MLLQCPLCGELTTGSTCLKCGYVLPSEEELAALYNLDPSDYPQTAAVREIVPEHISGEVYPDTAMAVPDIKVRGAAVRAAVMPPVNPITGFRSDDIQRQYAGCKSASGSKYAELAEYAKYAESVGVYVGRLGKLCRKFQKVLDASAAVLFLSPVYNNIFRGGGSQGFFG